MNKYIDFYIKSRTSIPSGGVIGIFVEEPWSSQIWFLETVSWLLLHIEPSLGMRFSFLNVDAIYHLYAHVTNIIFLPITPPEGDRSAGFYINFNIFNWILIDSGLKLLSYGPRFRINYSPPGNIGNWGLQHYL